MIKRLNVNELILSDLFFNTPVDAVNEMISTTNKNVILAGSRGSGRSVTFASREKEGIGTSDISIFSRFESGSKFYNNCDEFNDEFLEHFYEVCFSARIMRYLKTNYPNEFRRYFSSLDDDITRNVLDTNYYIRNASFENASLENKLHTGDVTVSLLNKMKEKLGVDSVTIMIDRFDWTQNSRKNDQEILARYFDIFDRSIITCDDSDFDLKSSSRFDGKRFDKAEIIYGNCVPIVREIVDKRFSLLEELDYGTRKVFPTEAVDDSQYSRIIERTGGNISAIIDVFSGADSFLQWDGERFDLDSSLEKSCTDVVADKKMLKQLSFPVKFHL